MAAGSSSGGSEGIKAGRAMSRSASTPPACTLAQRREKGGPHFGKELAEVGGTARPWGGMVAPIVDSLLK